jgi:hypothetical protein
MNGNKKVILHLIFDGILFDQVYPRFEIMENYENRFLFGSLNTDEEIKYIKNTEKLIRVDSLDEWGNIVSDSQVDVIYMHGLWPDYLKAIDYIRDNVVVMWWCYGMEIYENCFGLPPLMGLNIYKPKTCEFLESFGGYRSKMKLNLLFRHPKLYMLLRNIWNFIHKREIPESKLKKMLSRIDFAFTPLEVELQELKKKNPYIKAKPFILRGFAGKEPLVIQKDTGNILLEHSANISNNHLDIIAAIKDKKLNLQERDIYVPLSYGDERLAERVKDEAKFEGANVHCLMEALPINEYKKMLCGCTHAIFGMIRQSGLGNIYICFRKGIKVFLFKDSMLYNQFKADGYHVFSIDEDLDGVSIKEPLTEEQALYNYNLYYSKFRDLGSYQEQMDRILIE